MNESIAQQYQGVPAIVLGSTGFIGRWVARCLGQAGAKLYLPVRNPITADEIFKRYEIQGQVFKLDYQDEEAVRNYIGSVHPAIIFNLSGYGIDRSEQTSETAFYINGRLVEIICQTISEINYSKDWSGQRIIHTGTAMEYGLAGGDLHEDCLPRPTTLYGKSKLAGTTILTDYCSKNNIKGLTARLFAVYGPGELPERLVPTLIKQRHLEQPLEFTAGLHKRDFVYVEDVAEGLLRLGVTNDSKFSIVNLATGKLTSIQNFIKISAEVLGISTNRLKFGVLPTRPEEMKHDPVTNERLFHLTGWIPATTIKEGVESTVLFYKRTYEKKPV